MSRERGIGREHRELHEKGKCRWCLGPVEPPRRTFCGAACVTEWKLRTDVRFRREQVFARDRGTCNACGRECHALEARLLKLLYENPSELDAELGRLKLTRKAIEVPDGLTEDQRRRLVEIRTRYGAGEKVNPDLEVWAPGKSLWEADHVLEVADGGGSCSLSNMQTLCLWCHRAKSAESRRARAAARQNLAPPDDFFEGVVVPPDSFFDE